MDLLIMLAVDGVMGDLPNVEIDAVIAAGIQCRKELPDEQDLSVLQADVRRRVGTATKPRRNPRNVSKST